MQTALIRPRRLGHLLPGGEGTEEDIGGLRPLGGNGYRRSLASSASSLRSPFSREMWAKSFWPFMRLMR